MRRVSAQESQYMYMLERNSGRLNYDSDKLMGSYKGFSAVG